MIDDERRDCECGNFIVTNDPYMIDAWNEWHADGSFTAGSYHRPAAFVVKKYVGVFPHQCEGGEGCAFPGIPHSKEKVV